MKSALIAAYRKAELWFWARFFIFLIALGSGGHRYRMSHNNGIAARGKIRFFDHQDFPPTDFFEPGREFPCRIRHATVSMWDDAITGVRSATLKFADTDYASPLDIEMNTGDNCFFWNARSFLTFAFDRHPKDGTEYVKYYETYAAGRMSAASANLRSPQSFTDVYFHSHTPFGWHARDGKPRYVRFLLIPEDRRPQDPTPAPEYIAAAKADPGMAKALSDQRRFPSEKRNNNYLKEEYAKRVQSGPVRYILQIQLHEVSEYDPPEIRNPLMPWDPSTHPLIDLALVEITEVLTPEESAWMAFEITNLPKSISILPAKSLDDYNSLNYMRKQSIWAIRARRAMIRLLGPKKPIPDDAPPNYTPKGM